MRVAAIYDIHGNLPALEAVLQDIRREGVDEIVVGGDVIPGPMPCETLATLLDLDVPLRFIMGNGDREVLAQLAGTETGAVPERLRNVIVWVAKQITTEYEELISGWPLTVQIEVRGVGKVLFCHATPRNDTEIFTRLTPENRLLPILGELYVDVVVCGHTHMQFDRTIGELRVVNAGSVGMAYGEPGAYWLLLGPDIQLRHTLYDLAEGARRVRETSYPFAEDFAANNIMQPPSEKEALDVFTPAELK